MMRGKIRVRSGCNVRFVFVTCISSRVRYEDSSCLPRFPCYQIKLIQTSSQCDTMLINMHVDCGGDHVQEGGGGEGE
jgi:hypothetical protein